MWYMYVQTNMIIIVKWTSFINYSNDIISNKYSDNESNSHGLQHRSFKDMSMMSLYDAAHYEKCIDLMMNAKIQQRYCHASNQYFYNYKQESESNVFSSNSFIVCLWLSGSCR